MASPHQYARNSPSAILVKAIARDRRRAMLQRPEATMYIGGGALVVILLIIVLLLLL
jgi:hypothetical protein